jgi:hypothetical protein
LVERRRCEFSLIRYVPDPVKNEFVNIGVMLREQVAPGQPQGASGEPSRTELRFTRDWMRVRCIDPQADVAMLEALEGEVRERMGASPELLRLLAESLSNVVQMTEPKACLAETFQTQLEQLMGLYVETKKQPREQRRTGRVAIHAEMRRSFEREGVWELMRKRIAAASYTQAGDPLRIDCGYRPNGVIRMFHAVSLENDVEGAKGLAFSAPYLVAGVKEKEDASLQLTAIVEPIREVGEEQERVDQYRFGVETMERQSIRVLTVGDLERVAAAARVELRVG